MPECTKDMREKSMKIDICPGNESSRQRWSKCQGPVTGVFLRG